MSDRKRSSGGGRPLSFCYYHRRYEEEARKCSQKEPCEFKTLNEDNGQKQVLDLRNKLRPDLRNSLEKDLRVHLNKNHQGAKATAKRPKQDLRSKLSRPRATHEEESHTEIEKAQRNESYGPRSKRRPKEKEPEKDYPYDTQGGQPKQKGLRKGLSHPKTAKTPWEEKNDLLQSREEVEEEKRDLFERKSNSTPEKDIFVVHISQVEEEEDDEDDHLEASVPLTRTVVNNNFSIPRKIYINPNFPGNSRGSKIDPTNEYPQEGQRNHPYPSDNSPKKQEDRTEDKRKSRHSKKNSNNYKGPRFDSNSRKGTRYDPEDRQTSGSSSNNDPVYPGRKGYDRYSDSDDDPTTPRRRSRQSRHKQSEDNSDSDSENIRPDRKDLKTPREGRQKQRDKGRTANSGSSSYEEIVNYLKRQHQRGLDDEKEGADRSGMPIKKSKPDQCPVPPCEASNKAEKNNKGRYEDTEVAHRFLLNCPIIRAMNVTERWSFYDKNGCTCTGCFSTTHNFQSCPLQLNFAKLCKAKEQDGILCNGAHHKLLHVDSHM